MGRKALVICRDRAGACRNARKVCAGFDEAVVRLVEGVKISSAREVVRLSL